MSHSRVEFGPEMGNSQSGDTRGVFVVRASEDPLAFVAAFAVMTLASAAACFLPAWRATQTDPIRALRAE
jgi:ABC-type lipoprotein release transport system permease subunit